MLFIRLLVNFLIAMLTLVFDLLEELEKCDVIVLKSILLIALRALINLWFAFEADRNTTCIALIILLSWSLVKALIANKTCEVSFIKLRIRKIRIFIIKSHYSIEILTTSLYNNILFLNLVKNISQQSLSIILKLWLLNLKRL